MTDERPFGFEKINTTNYDEAEAEKVYNVGYDDGFVDGLNAAKKEEE